MYVIRNYNEFEEFLVISLEEFANIHVLLHEEVSFEIKLLNRAHC